MAEREREPFADERMLFTYNIICNASNVKENYFFIIMFEFDTRHIVVLKLANALFLWKLVRALKLKKLLFVVSVCACVCVDKFKYKTNYRCTLRVMSHGYKRNFAGEEA